MKLSLQWLRDYAAIPDLSPQELLETITISICEVEGTHSCGEVLQHVRCAQVVEATPHPNADKLQVVRIQTGENSYEELVCGAKNFAVGNKVAFAPVGTTLPDGLELAAVKIRGVQSNGMLCSESELGLSEDHEGILILDAQTPIGTPLDRIFADAVDCILEIDNKSITHRPDLWGHYGFARELAALYALELKTISQSPADLSGTGESLLKVQVHSTAQVPRFSGLSLDGVQVSTSSDRIRHRLHRVGLRAINNLVDITNYIMLDRGQPMHIFDVDQVVDQKLEIRFATSGDEMITLYQKTAKLTADDVVIYDGGGATAIAGIIGGLRSGVNENTTRVYLEAGNWNGSRVRRSSMRLGVRTDASQRYEKSLDPEMTISAIAAAVDLLRESCPKLRIVGNLFDQRQSPPYTPAIRFSPELARRRLGAEVSDQQQRELLESLGFGITPADSDPQEQQEHRKKYWSVQVPTWRSTKDVSIAEDLIEEVGRLIDYNSITPVAPLFAMTPPLPNAGLLLERKAKYFAAHTGYHEVYTYPMGSLEEENRLRLERSDRIELLNPVSEKQHLMRSSALPQLLDCIAHNQKHDLDFRLFESGRNYASKGQGASMENNVFWLVRSFDPQSTAMETAFAAFARDARNLIKSLKVPSAQLVPTANPTPYMHPHISCDIVVGTRTVGQIFTLHISTAQAKSLKGKILFAELDMDCLLALSSGEYSYQPIPKYPPVYLDLSVVVDQHTRFAQVQDCIAHLDPCIAEITFSDIFFLEEAPTQKSLTVSVVLRSEQGTLSSEKVQAVHTRIIDQLTASGYPLRS